MYVHPLGKIKELKRLRKIGYSINELVEKFSIPKTTVWHHVKGIKINAKHIRSWKGKRGGSKKKSLLEWEKARAEAKKLIRNLSKTDRILITAALYWAEGSKGDFSLSNTDPQLVRTFVQSLKILGVKNEDLSMNIRVYEDLDKERAIGFWVKVTGIPKYRIKYVDVLKGRKNGKLLYGMCRIRVIKGRYFFKLLNAIIDIIKDKILVPVA